MCGAGAVAQVANAVQLGPKSTFTSVTHTYSGMNRYSFLRIIIAVMIKELVCCDLALMRFITECKRGEVQNQRWTNDYFFWLFWEKKSDLASKAYFLFLFFIPLLSSLLL